MENLRGGKRMGAGRKPVGLKKQPETFYVTPIEINNWGGHEQFKKNIYEIIQKGNKNSNINIQDLNEPTHQIKPMEAMKPESVVFVPPKPQSINLGNFDAYHDEILATTMPDELKEIMSRLKSELMTGKQKADLEAIAKEHSKDFFTD